MSLARSIVRFFPSKRIVQQASLTVPRGLAPRYLSALTEGDSLPAYTKLLDAVEEYRRKNFSQTLFSRFVKEMIHAMDINHDGKITSEELHTLLSNIGAEKSISMQDVRQIMEAFGTMDESLQEMVISVYDVESLILDGNRKSP